MVDPSTGGIAVLPTNSHTWVEPSDVTVGWWSGTTHPGEWDGDTPEDRATLPDVRAAWSMFSDLQARLPGPTNSLVRSKWYGRGWGRDDGAMQVFYAGVGRARGSVMLSARQSWWEQADAPDLIAWFGALTRGWHVSRLDLAADDRAPDHLTPRALYDRLPAARSRSRPEHRALTTDWAGNEKLTIGSRASARYGRIYVKGERVRHELELKQDVAGRAWVQLTNGVSVPRVWADEYRRLVEWQSS